MHKINKFYPHQHHIFKIILLIILIRAKIKKRSSKNYAPERFYNYTIRCFEITTTSSRPTQ